MTPQDAFSQLLKDDIAIREVEPGIFSALTDDVANSYDTQGALSFYDSVACHPVYNRLMWGYKIARLHTFCADLLDAGTGWHLDAGCGSLAFTSKAYARTSRPLVLMDLSLTLLKKTRERLADSGTTPENILLIQGDVTDMPFKAAAFGSALSMNMLHVLDNPNAMISEIKRVITPTGNIGFTTLHMSGRWSDRYMKTWENKGELICRSLPQIKALLEQEHLHTALQTQGNMAFATASRR